MTRSSAWTRCAPGWPRADGGPVAAELVDGLDVKLGSAALSGVVFGFGYGVDFVRRSVATAQVDAA